MSCDSLAQWFGRGSTHFSGSVLSVGDYANGQGSLREGRVNCKAGKLKLRTSTALFWALPFISAEMSAAIRCGSIAALGIWSRTALFLDFSDDSEPRVVRPARHDPPQHFG
jgi:hypothetical protein